MKLILFSICTAALLLVALLPPTELHLREISQLHSIPTGSKVTVQGIAIGGKLCNFPNCVKINSREKISGKTTVTATVQRKWGNETLAIEKAE